MKLILAALLLAFVAACGGGDPEPPQYQCWRDRGDGQRIPYPC